MGIVDEGTNLIGFIDLPEIIRPAVCIATISSGVGKCLLNLFIGW